MNVKCNGTSIWSNVCVCFECASLHGGMPENVGSLSLSLNESQLALYVIYATWSNLKTLPPICHIYTVADFIQFEISVARLTNCRHKEFF